MNHKYKGSLSIQQDFLEKTSTNLNSTPRKIRSFYLVTPLKGVDKALFCETYISLFLVILFVFRVSKQSYQRESS